MTAPTSRPHVDAPVAVGSMGQWARDIADTYRQMAATEKWDQRRSALETEAQKYENIAKRMDQIQPFAEERTR